MTRVALTMRVTAADGYSESRDSISHDWTARLAEWEMTPLPVPNLGERMVAYLVDLRPDILVLTGGDDIGATPLRDATENALLDHAVAVGLPVFGVCRGLQVINVRRGGRLVAVDGHVGKPHTVTVAPLWRGLYGASVTVNSYHGQGVAKDGIGDGLVVTATDDYGRVEALCHREKALAAVMWHPERRGGLAGDRVLLAGLAAGRIPWR